MNTKLSAQCLGKPPRLAWPDRALSFVPSISGRPLPTPRVFVAWYLPVRTGATGQARLGHSSRRRALFYGLNCVGGATNAAPRRSLRLLIQTASVPFWVIVPSVCSPSTAFTMTRPRWEIPIAVPDGHQAAPGIALR